MQAFRAFQVQEKAGEVSNSIKTLSLDELSKGDVVIRVEYSSVNYKDALAATGKGNIIRGYPRVPGVDAAGTVESSESDRFKPGDAVLITGYDFGTAHDGGYAEYARVPAEWVVMRPKGMDAFAAMSLGTAGFTAGLCIQRMEHNGQHPSKGPIIVSGATGGVGTLAVDMLSNLGYEVIAVTGKSSSHEYLMELGAAEVLDRSKINFNGPPLEKGQWGGAIDNVGGDILAWLTRTVLPWGNIASVGLAGGSHLNATVMPFILRGVSLLGISSSGCPTEWRAPIWQRLASDLAPRHLDKIVNRVIEMDDLPAVFNEMLTAKTRGRTVVKISE